MTTGRAFILDNRDGQIEPIFATSTSFHAANTKAFINAEAECDERNQREYFMRFVPINHRAAKQLQKIVKMLPENTGHIEFAHDVLAVCVFVRAYGRASRTSDS